MAKDSKTTRAADIERLVRRYRITSGRKFRLRDIDPGETGGLRSKEHAETLTRQGVEALASLQERLYAQDQWGVLLIFQAMDAAGKDGAIKHVMSGINPQGCQVYSFKAPSSEELDHDFMWRTTKNLPERGRIGIFNRSYYEEVLMPRKLQLNLDYLSERSLASDLGILVATVKAIVARRRESGS